MITIYAKIIINIRQHHPFQPGSARSSQTVLDFNGAWDAESSSGADWNCVRRANLQSDHHHHYTSTVFYRPDTFPATQPTESDHWKQLTEQLKCWTWY